MIILFIILSCFTIIIILIYDKKGSVKELERYYQNYNTVPKRLRLSKKPEKGKP